MTVDKRVLGNLQVRIAVVVKHPYDVIAMPLQKHLLKRVSMKSAHRPHVDKNIDAPSDS